MLQVLTPEEAAEHEVRDKAMFDALSNKDKWGLAYIRYRLRTADDKGALAHFVRQTVNGIQHDYADLPPHPEAPMPDEAIERAAMIVAYQRRLDLDDTERFADDGVTRESYWRALATQERELVRLRTASIVSEFLSPEDEKLVEAVARGIWSGVPSVRDGTFDLVTYEDCGENQRQLLRMRAESAILALRSYTEQSK